MKQRSSWQQGSREAMERFIEHLQDELGPEASIAEIEQAMLRHYQELLSEVMQNLVENQEFPPSGAPRSKMA
jgi:hypothetical protein